MNTRHAVAARAVSQPPEEERERDQAEVGLRLAAAGRKPEQVGSLAVLVVGVDDARQAQQDEGELERAASGGRLTGRDRLPAVPLLVPVVRARCACIARLASANALHARSS